MDADRRRRIEDLCHAALERDASSRAVFVATACGSDEALRREVEALLAHAQTADGFLSTPLDEIAARALGDGRGESLLGRSLGPYQISTRLGSGGMGEVYRARDTKLRRDVAVKILPAAFTIDPERLARFQREARALAALNHPHIAAIYGLDESNGTQFLVLELVEGATLADRIARGPIPLGDALPIARQIAEALEAAHEKGIVHRDLKPANIALTANDQVKVLDFGLAKALEPETGGADLANSPTITTPAMTRTGVILGTAAYMSPEQARGRPVTKQTDIWAFGCVLYEMLTGSVAFSGETVSDTVAKILKEEPDWRLASAPPAVRRIVDRCLCKDMRQRFHDAADVRVDIEEALVPTRPPPRANGQSRRVLLLLAALAIVAISLVGAVWLRSPTKRELPRWSGTRLSGPPIAYAPRVSPDGNMLTFQVIIDGTSEVGVMNPKSGNWVVLTHNKEGGFVNYASWSRDGTKILFSRDQGGVFSISALGGEPRLLIEDAMYPEALVDGNLVVQRANAQRIFQLHQFRPDSQALVPLNALVDSQSGLIEPSPRFRVLPDGKRLVFVGRPADSPNAPQGVYVLDINGNNVRRLAFDVSPILGIGVDARDGSVLVDVLNGDLQQIISIPTTGPSIGRVLLTLTDLAPMIDMATDGSLYVDQVSRPLQTLRLTESGRVTQSTWTIPVVGTYSVLELPDGRVLLTAAYDGRPRLTAATQTGELTPFVDTDEDTRGPAALVGSGRVAFMIGRLPLQWSIAIASAKDGRVAQRLRVPDGFIGSLTASSDGATLFYSDAGSIWSIPSAGGESRKLGPGDAVAFDPRSHSLVVQVNEQETMRLVRMPVTGGTTEPIHVRGEPRLTSLNDLLGSHAVGADGRIVVTASFKDSIFHGPAIIDPVTGSLKRLFSGYYADVLSPSWNQRNEVVASVFVFHSSLWRFRSESMPAVKP